jgi:NAD(P)-dependent dehydrogenase (short-subunit alcohol dehydrogenase family)
MAKTIVITGAGRGIGRQLVLNALSSGNRVVAGVRDPAAAKALEDMGLPDALEVAELDVTDATSVRRMADSLGERPVDILINNAGVMGGDRQSLDDMDYDAWRDALEVNTLSPFRVTTALLPNLARSPQPKIITLTSQMGALSRNSPGVFAYRSSKAAANKVMQVMALELKARGMIVCPMHPGWVRTDMGGPAAAISVEESARGLLEVIDRLGLEDSGRFWTWEGVEHPW